MLICERRPRANYREMCVGFPEINQNVAIQRLEDERLTGSAVYEQGGIAALY